MQDQPAPSGVRTQQQVSFRLESFAPGWGGAVMGTAIIAVVMAAIGWPTWMSRTMLVVTSLLAAAVLSLTAARWIRHRGAALADLRHPVKGGMTATAAGGMLAWAVALARVGTGWLPQTPMVIAVASLTLVGTVLALFIGWEFMAALFTGEGTPMEHITGAWFIPPVVTIIVPLALVPLAEELPGAAESLLAAGWALLGIGLVLYLLVTAALFLRTITHPLPAAALAPTLVIGMGPAGLVGLDVLRLGGSAEPAFTATATMMWGFGLWWLVAAVLVLRRGYDDLPFSLAWWGFVFPFGAWTASTIAVAQAWDVQVFTVLAWIAAVLLVAGWLAIAARTVKGIADRSIWKG